MPRIETFALIIGAMKSGTTSFHLVDANWSLDAEAASRWRVPAPAPADAR